MPTVERAMKALKAVVLPMKMHARTAWKPAASRMALTGTLNRGETWAKNLGNGMPLSLAKAQVVRELEARKS
jgi:hypothetical protein